MINDLRYDDHSGAPYIISVFEVFPVMFVLNCSIVMFIMLFCFVT